MGGEFFDPCLWQAGRCSRRHFSNHRAIAVSLLDWVVARGKNLIAIYITHGQGDHFFGRGTAAAWPLAAHAQPPARSR